MLISPYFHQHVILINFQHTKHLIKYTDINRPSSIIVFVIFFIKSKYHFKDYNSIMTFSLGLYRHTKLPSLNMFLQKTADRSSFYRDDCG